MTDRPYVHLRRDLRAEQPRPAWPAGIGPAAFDAGRHAAQLHALLSGAYAVGGGSVPPFAAWWPDLRGDPEFDASLVFLALDGEGRIAGAAQCWTSAYVKDLAVAGRWRRRGVGTALLLHAFRCFRERGASHVDLKMEADNPSGAMRLYERVGMRRVPD